MAINVTFYTFAKKANSTAQPSGGTSYSCVIKSASSVLSPEIILDVGTGSRPVYNYAYIPDYGRYYWVREWTWIENRLWAGSLEVDVLATYKTEIGSENVYVLRSSAAFDGNIVDTLYPFKSNSGFTKTTALNPFFFNPSDTSVNVGAGTYVLGIAGGGYTQYIGMSEGNLQNLMNQLKNNYVTQGNGFSPDDATLALQQALIDPFQYIKSCKWFPVTYAGFGNEVGATYVGDFAFSIAHKYPSNYWRGGQVSIALPKHSQAAARGAWLNAAGMRYELEYGPFGKISLDPSKACNYSYLVLRHQMDFVSGNAWLEVGYNNSQGTIAELETIITSQIGVDVQLSQVYHSALSRMVSSGIAKAVQGGLSSNPNPYLAKIGAMNDSALNAVGSIVAAMGASLDTLGGGGGFADINMGLALYSQELVPADEDNYHNGRPLCQFRTLASLGGFALVQNGDIPISGTREEHDAIESYLESGVFFE